MRTTMLGRLTIVGLAALTILSLGGARERPAFVERGTASWYGPGFHGRATASGMRFNQNQLTAAHPELPLGARVTVTNLDNGLSTEVMINDRGPHRAGRIIDLSKAAARRLGMIDNGVAPVRVEATPVQLAQAQP